MYTVRVRGGGGGGGGGGNCRWRGGNVTPQFKFWVRNSIPDSYV